MQEMREKQVNQPKQGLKNPFWPFFLCVFCVDGFCQGCRIVFPLCFQVTSDEWYFGMHLGTARAQGWREKKERKIERKKENPSWRASRDDDQETKKTAMRMWSALSAQREPETREKREKGGVPRLVSLSSRSAETHTFVRFFCSLLIVGGDTWQRPFCSISILPCPPWKNGKKKCYSLDGTVSYSCVSPSFNSDDVCDSDNAVHMDTFSPVA